MDVAVVIVEQLDADGFLRTFRMQAEFDERLTVAFADEYDEPRSGPFHFLDDRHERAFGKAFAECKSRRVSNTRFSSNGRDFHFRTSWAGIPTERQRLSYYALCLPEQAIPSRVRFSDPRSGREFKKAVVRDDQRARYVLYLECRSSHGTFDFGLDVEFRIAQEEFLFSNFLDDTTTPYGAHVDAYEYLLPDDDRKVVHNFFTQELFVGDQNNVHGGQVGAMGSGAKAENNTFNQIMQQAAANIDLPALVVDLGKLRASMRQEATEIEHDQAIASVAAAEVAAKKHDGGDALKHLASAGKWAFDVATKIGTSVAAKAIQTAIGM